MRSDLSNITLATMPDRTGQLLRNTLLDRGFGDADRAGDTKLVFNELSETEIDLGIAPDNTATRRQVTITGVLVITRKGEIILERKLTSRATYNVLVSQYGTIVSKENAQKQAIDDLARQIEIQTTLLWNNGTP